MKNNKVLITIYILMFIFATLGATFAYFSASVKSNNDITDVTSASFSVDLSVLPLYTGKAIIPLNNSDIMTAYEHECVDSLGNGACYAYTIKVSNNGGPGSYSGTIKFNLDNITNLNYLLLDSDKNEYTEITEIVSDTDQSLGSEFSLAADEDKEFILLVWLPNYNYAQEDNDASGTFSASVTYSSGPNGRVTAVFSH